ncbi:DNA replication regulator SLD2 [Cladophialophora carrionii]|uniref:DNA replication regulator SLD2 n=1 Tax=Cladophialophora carrionii TaxID=86049 RepID=A0A1C1CGF5_9EURO|nr:DNA replication regulator SLD2 [Cladophialophora carrionii]
MDDAVALLDSPKQVSLQSQADTLRVELKDYERDFAAEHNGRKPSRDEIKANQRIAGKYQQYQNIRMVLAGKRGLEVLKTPKRQQITRTRHGRTDSAISLTPHRPRSSFTPTKPQIHPNDIDPYDPPSSISPRAFPNAIGPTPRRDGTVLGIFDLLSNSGSRGSSQATPSSRKRKIDALYRNEDRHEDGHTEIAQTPSQKLKQSTIRIDGALGVATPGSTMATGKRKHSKTPISEGKKFMLNHFFATPSAVRFAGVIGGDGEATPPAQSKTPLRDLVLGTTPTQNRFGAQTGVNDATPPYLKRSFSFKERLLSASGDQNSASSTARRSLSGSLRHGKFAPKPLSQIIADRQQSQNKESQNQRNDDGDEDDMDALREMEVGEVNILVEDSQFLDESNQTLDNGNPEADQPGPAWRKKGQKRTTRRVIMRPVRLEPAAPARQNQKRKTRMMMQDDEMDEEADEDNNTVSFVEETQLVDTPPASEPELEDSDLDFLDDDTEPKNKAHQGDPDEGDNFQPNEDGPSKIKKSRSKANPSLKRSKSKPVEDPARQLGKPSKSKKASKNTEAKEETGRMINPNAYSHMNFKSLKIKNKNSKAKGRGRFGRGRR